MQAKIQLREEEKKIRYRTQYKKLINYLLFVVVVVVVVVVVIGTVCFFNCQTLTLGIGAGIFLGTGSFTTIGSCTLISEVDKLTILNI